MPSTTVVRTIAAPIERVFLSVLASRRAGRRKIPIHIFPTRFDEAGLARLAPLRAHDEDRDRLWTELQVLYEAFEADHRVPEVQIDRKSGDYVVATSSS